MPNPRGRALLLPCLCFLVAAPGAEALSAQVPAPAPGRPARAALMLPERLRQGDPLVGWALSEPDLVGAEARLLPAADGAAGNGAAAVPVAAASLFAGPALSPLPLVGVSPVFRAFGFVMAVPAELAPGAYRLVVDSAGPVSLSAPVSIEARSFPTEVIPLDAANSKLRTEPDPRKEAEAKRLYEILGRADADAVYLDGSPFMMPLVPRRRSAGFGDRRRYLYEGGGSDASVHAGVDLAVATGTEVWACGPGRVVLAADRAVTGLTVVLEHLPGLYSLYMHLSSIAVREGQALERGAVLGRSGSTGLSTGPHLHWELRAGGQAVDPEFWLSRPPLDKNRAAAIMAGLIEGR